MQTYRYVAMDMAGKTHRGKIEAATLDQATQVLKSNGWWLTEIEAYRKSILFRDIQLGGPKVKGSEFTLFCRQLATLYNAGIHMVEAVQMLGEQANTKVFKNILLDVADEMSKGTAFSAAIVKYPTVFSDVFVNMVRAGEAGGNLDDMLERISLAYEKEYSTKQKVRSALIYPTIMGIVTVIVVTILITFVVPKMVQNFAQMNLELPLPTRIVIAVSDWMQSFWYVPIALVLSLPFLLQYLRKKDNGRYLIDKFRLKIPVFGKLWHKQALARFTRTFSSLYAASIPMLQMMSLVATVIDNEVMAKQVRDSLEGVRSGDSLVKPFEGSKYFPPMVVQMLAVGEKTGQLDVMMGKAADFYETEVETMADRLKTLLEPVMILILSGIVGMIVLAVMLPSFKMMENIQ